MLSRCPETRWRSVRTAKASGPPGDLGCNASMVVGVRRLPPESAPSPCRCGLLGRADRRGFEHSVILIISVIRCSFICSSARRHLGEKSTAVTRHEIQPSWIDLENITKFNIKLSDGAWARG